MVKRRKRWWHPFQRIALFVIGPILVILFVLSMPIWMPFLGWSMARDDRRKRTLAQTWPCGWCVAPLGEIALSRADALEAAEARHIDEEWTSVFSRHQRILHASCPRCGAAHRFNAKAQAFRLLHPREFGSKFDTLMEETLPAPTCPMAWPWLKPAGPMHQVQVTREPIASLGELDQPPPAEIEVPADVEVAAIAEALLRSPWLPDLGPSARWHCMAGSVNLAFGKEAGLPFIQRSGDIRLRADAVNQVHLAYADDRNDHDQQAGAR